MGMIHAGSTQTNKGAWDRPGVIEKIRPPRASQDCMRLVRTSQPSGAGYLSHLRQGNAEDLGPWRLIGFYAV